MSEAIVISGKRFPLADSSPAPRLEARPGGWIVAELADGRRCRIAAWEARGRIGVSVGGRLYDGELVEQGARGAAGLSEGAELVAQFPGRVRKILVEAGARVEAGAPLILVEAMKMEFTVKAPAPGVVRSVRVAEGQQLSPGDRFLDFEADSSVSLEREP